MEKVNGMDVTIGRYSEWTTVNGEAICLCHETTVSNKKCGAEHEPMDRSRVLAHIYMGTGRVGIAG